jgi:hypothetical protein
MTFEQFPRVLSKIGFLLLCLLFSGFTQAATPPTAYKVAQVAVKNATATFGQGLNTSGAVVGLYTTASATEGYMYASGKYSLIKVPKSNNVTRAFGINDSNLIVGDFLGTDGFYHGFKLSGTKYTQYDVDKGVVSTSIFGVNNAGDFVGIAGAEGYVNIGGTVTEFYASGTDATYAYGVNTTDEIVGQYFDSSNNSHGFYRDSSGTITEVAYPGALQTVCLGINDSGEIVGYYENSANQFYGFTDIAGVFATIDLLNINGVNNNGVLSGSYIGPGPTGGVEYGIIATPTALKSLSSVAVPKAVSTSIIGVNNAGSLVGFYETSASVFHGLLLVGKTITNLDDPKGLAGTTSAQGINTANEVVGYYQPTSTTWTGFLYSAGTFTDIAVPGATSTFAENITDAGLVAGAYIDSSSVEHAFTYDGSTYTTLDVPGSTSGYGWGINAAGEVTITWIDANGLSEGALYNGTTFKTLNVPGAYETFIHSINKSGAIAYTWYDLYFNYHAAFSSGGNYYIFDDPSGTAAHADGINDGGLIVGRFLQGGSTTDYDGFKATP